MFSLILKAVDLGIYNVLNECKGRVEYVSIERLKLMRKLGKYIENPHHNRCGNYYCLQLNRKQASMVFRDLCSLPAYAEKYDASRVPTDRTKFDRILTLLIIDLKEWITTNFKGLQIL